MADTAIDIRNLHKVYRLYDKPVHRLLDMFGLLFKKGVYTEHHALSDVNLKVERGEKVAIIGRNGAGKSTLLKIISKVLAATEGDVQINGTVHALLSIGTGFHDDFTGRENIYAYLTNLGISGEEADKKVADIIDFAEIDEFIDQPVGTYSTGMGVRLMFAASTAITPDILIVDEVLGVGDAYYVQKSINHMRQLCADQGTTLLLVSHDIYTAAQICDRVIWIDQGHVFQDGPATDVLRAYEASIRLQEEGRIRQRMLKRRQLRERKGEPVFFQIVPKDRSTQHPGMTVKGIRLLQDGLVIDQVDMESGLADSGRLLLDDMGNWSAPYEKNGKIERDFLSYGSVYQRAPFVLNVPESTDGVFLEIDGILQGDCQYYLEGYSLKYQTICKALDMEVVGKVVPIPLSFGKSSVDSGRKVAFGLESHTDIIQSGMRLGSKSLEVGKVWLSGSDDKERYVFSPGDAASIHVEVKVNDPQFKAAPEIMATILKDGVTVATRLYNDSLVFSAEEGGKQYISINLPHLNLGKGTYSITIGLMAPGYFMESQYTHCAVSQKTYDLFKNSIFFSVETSNMTLSNVQYIQDALWEKYKV